MSAAAPEARRATKPATSLAGSEATGFLGSTARRLDRPHLAGVKMPIGAAEIRGLGDGNADDRHLVAAQIVEICLVIGSGMYRRQRADQLESVAFGAAGDQGVEAVLGSEGVCGVTSPTSEAGDTPLVGIRTVACVPGLMGPVEVADTEVDHSGPAPPPACRAASGTGAEARWPWSHSLNALLDW